MNNLGGTVHFELVNANGVYDSGVIDPNNVRYIALGPQVSVKLDWDGSFTSPYQFEFNYDSGSNQIWYDLSAVNGDPFVNNYRTIVPYYGNCETIICAPGDSSNDCQFTTSNNGAPVSCNVPGGAYDVALTFTLS